MSEKKESKEEKKDGASFLVLGGLGFIGRHFVEYLVDNKLASSIMVADKMMPATAYLTDKHKALFKNKEIITYKQSDLAKDDHVARIFKDNKFDYVVNLCGETRFGLGKNDYKIRSLDPAVKCAAAAIENGVKKFVEVSTAQIYQSKKSASDEDAKIDPWTMQAKFRHDSEVELGKLEKLPLVTLRPAMVYGVDDRSSITPRIICAAVYQSNKEKMKLLWSKGLCINVVHVDDVCEAIWLACSKFKVGTVYNLEEGSAFKQGDLLDMLGSVFGISTGFLGDVVSTVAKADLGYVAGIANDKHVPEWTKMCHAQKIQSTPLSPYIDKELVSNHHLSVNGTKITKENKDFTYKNKISEQTIRDVIAGFVDQGIFPTVKLTEKKKK